MFLLKSCPFCGGKAKIIGGSEDWSPSFYDPDSGGDPYSIKCEKCNAGFAFESYEPDEVINKWNKRV